MPLVFAKRTEKAMNFALKWLKEEEEDWNVDEIAVHSIEVSSRNRDEEFIKENIAEDMREQGSSESDIKEFIKDQTDNDLYFWIWFCEQSEDTIPLPKGKLFPFDNEPLTKNWVELQLAWNEDEEEIKYLGSAHP